jgi:hypothetical protein
MDTGGESGSLRLPILTDLGTRDSWPFVQRVRQLLAMGREEPLS